MKWLLAVLFALILAGCGSVTTISKSTGPTVSAGSVLGKDLVAAGANLDQAIAIGILPASDPAAVCVHGVLVQVGLENPVGAPPAASFEASRQGVVSEGSIVYIKIQQFKNLKTVGISPECYALIGKLQVDGLKVGLGLAPLLK